MRYDNTLQAIFLDRPNRFIAHVDIGGSVETVHVKNTGRCRELLIPGAEVTLTAPGSAGRKTKYDLVAVNKRGVGWINIDSQLPNAAVGEWLASKPAPFEDLTLVRPEYTYGASRVDFYLECGEREILLEVKGCTLENDGVGYFPDAPTERGVKHLRELMKARGEGRECYIAFVIAVPGVKEVLPNRQTHAAFGEALDEAQRAGVHILYLPCEVSPGELRITDCILR